MMIKNMLPALQPGATIVSYGVLEQTPAPILNSDMIYRNLGWKGFGIDHWLSTSGARRGEMVGELWAAMRGHRLTLPVRARYSLVDVVAAVADAAMTGRSGKVLIADV
jgi:NADPH:quinone reductase-like Zn-dependent oxidoreductase